MSEKKMRTKIITIKEAHINNLKIKGPNKNPFIMKNLTLGEIGLTFKLPPERKE